MDGGGQKPWTDMSAAEQEHAKAQIAQFLEEHRETAENPDGILSPPVNPETGEEAQLYWHQVNAALRVMRMDGGKEVEERHASMLAVHDVGTGKTIMAILILAAVHRLVAQARRNSLSSEPDKARSPAATKVVIIAPKSLLTMWETTLKEWTCTSFHQQVLVVRKQELATPDALRGKQVILVSPSALTAAFKQGVRKLEKTRKVMGQSLGAQLTTKTITGQLIDAHPLFAMLPRVKKEVRNGREKYRPSFRTPVALTIIDEIHLNLEPSNWQTAAIQQFTNNSRIVIGLTGTPVKTDPSEVAYMAQLLNVRDPHKSKGVTRREFQSPNFYKSKYATRDIDRGAVEAFRSLFVDRVDRSFVNMPPLVETVVEYDPFVGVGPDGTRDENAIRNHNEVLRRAKGLAVNSAQEEQSVTEPSPKVEDEEDPTLQELEEREDLPPPAPVDTLWSPTKLGVFSAMIKLGHYELSTTLGQHGATEFNKNDALFQDAIERPSQAMLLIERVMRNRQNEGGHARIAVFAEYLTQLRIVQRYLEGDASFGNLYLLHGKLGDKKRDVVLEEFLACKRGVLFLTKAGGVGLNLQKGCACMIAVGSLPWNAADMEQVIGRVYRLGQQKPVEFIQLVARRSITAAKRGLHEDKSARLSEALKNGNYENFAVGELAWRWTSSLLNYVAELDSAGNYKVTPMYLEALRNHASGKPGSGPSSLQSPVLPSRMALPRFTLREV
tara:strand:- start:139 stop:2310 length:2172 start_codon:yes stop_codon:yes gene_type:complete